MRYIVFQERFAAADGEKIHSFIRSGQELCRMAKNGRKLELYEILAAKRAKGKLPLALEATAKQANQPDPPSDVVDFPGVIIDDAVDASSGGQASENTVSGGATGEIDTAARIQDTVMQPPPSPPPQAVVEPVVRTETRRGFAFSRDSAPAPERKTVRLGQDTTVQPKTVEYPPEPEPRPRSPREVVFALDTALIFLTVVLALVGCSYFIGYKRGQEERPAGLAGLTEIDTMDPERLNIRNLAPAPRAAVRPPEQDYTLILRTEPATANDLPERLELELAEALARGRQQAGKEIPGFIFRTVGNAPHYILAVGLGQSANDQNLNELLQIYYAMEGVTLSREPKPYRGCRVAPIRELGTPVY